MIFKKKKKRKSRDPLTFGAFNGVFVPTILFLPFKPKRMHLNSLARIFKIAKEHEVGIILADRDENTGLGSEEDVHIIPVTKYSDISRMKKISTAEEKSFFFVADSGKEDVLA